MIHAEVGNAVALVRLIQQAKWRQKAGAAQYLGLAAGEVAPGFADAVPQDPSPGSQELIQAARLLDRAVDGLSADSHAGTVLPLPCQDHDGTAVQSQSIDCYLQNTG